MNGFSQKWDEDCHYAVRMDDALKHGNPGTVQVHVCDTIWCCLDVFSSHEATGPLSGVDGNVTSQRIAK